MDGLEDAGFHVPAFPDSQFLYRTFERFEFVDWN